MTISVQLATVVDSISKLSVSGVTMKDMDEIAASWKALPNVCYPRPDNFITGLSVTSVELSRHKYDLRYTLNYRFLHVRVGNTAVLFAAYPTLIAKVVLIINSIITNHAVTGAMDLTFGGLTASGVIADPAGNQFLAADFAINVLEFLEA